MARPQYLSDARGKSRASKPRDEERRTRGIKKEGSTLGPIRRSERISQLQNNSEEIAIKLRQLSILAEENYSPPQPWKGQKLPREAERLANHMPTKQPPKRLRASIPSPSCRDALSQGSIDNLTGSQRDHINHWACQGQSWPEEFFRERSEQSLAAITNSSDESKDEKSAPYRNPNYGTLLQDRGGLYMEESEQGITNASETLCRTLLKGRYATPENTIFRDDAFANACRKLQGSNKARIIQDIARLLVPSVETLTTLGDKLLSILSESVDVCWNSCALVMNPPPQPDYTAAFRRSAFSDDQLSKLTHLLGDTSSLTCYFPVLTCEVMCGTMGLDIADQKNGHSMAVAVRSIIKIFRLVKRESELHRQLLTFSVSHNHRTVRLYGYYPIIDGHLISIYRHPIHTFDITALDGKERWTTYNFTVGVYIYSLSLLDVIRSVIDDLP